MSDRNLIESPIEHGVKLSKFEGVKAINSNNYRSLIGSLRYLTCTRSDISFVVDVTSRFIKNPKHSYLKAVKRILRYIKRTENLRLQNTETNKFELTSYVNNDWCRDVDDRKKTSGHMIVEEITHRHIIDL
jgi:hypothetical protein